MKKITILFLLIGLLFASCGKANAGEDLMKDVKSSNKSLLALSEDTPIWDNTLVSDFGVRLLQASLKEGANTLISPQSMLSVLAMTANGADGNTLAQMEAVLGQPVEGLNNWYKHGTDQKDTYLHQANGIWFNRDSNITVNEAFLQKNADYYSAGIYRVPFDAVALKSINGFVEEHTKGMIPHILDSISEDAGMYLVNALSFKAQWKQTYDRASQGIFTGEDGQTQLVDMMYSEESIYLEDELATGFLKFYKGNRYAFLAMLPNEGVRVEEYVQSLDGASLRGLITNLQEIPVNAGVPKFQTEFDVEMTDALKSMGMTDAFDPIGADFSRMGSSSMGNLYLSHILHKTYIQVGEKGTKAGAASAAVMAEGAAEMERAQVILDRPFFYMILDMESNTPIFMGTLMDVE